MISTLTRATQGKVYIPGIGLGQKVIGFPQSMTGKKGRTRNPFGIMMPPEFNQTLRDILTSGDSVKEMKEQY